MRAPQSVYNSQIYEKEAENRCVFRFELKPNKVRDDVTGHFALLVPQRRTACRQTFTDGLIGVAASGWISLHKIWKIHKIQNINTKQNTKYKPTV